jgi:hypothetical protein
MVGLHNVIVVVAIDVFEGKVAAVDPSTSLLHQLSYEGNSTSSRVFIGSVRAIAFGMYLRI